MKLTLHHRAETLRARYTDIQSVETNQTAHISLQLSINVKEQTPRAKNQTVAPIPQRARLITFPRCPQSILSVPAASAAPQRLSSAGEGGSKV